MGVGKGEGDTEERNDNAGDAWDGRVAPALRGKCPKDKGGKTTTFVPIESMPGWLQPFTSINPVTNAVDLGRSLSQGGPIVANAITTALWTIGMTIVIGPIAVWQYRRV